MKYIALWALALLLLVSCKKPNPGNEQNIATQFKDLVVNEDFDWRMSHEIDIDIRSSLGQLIRITSADGKYVFHTGKVTDPSGSYHITLTIPNSLLDLTINGINMQVTDQIVVDLSAYKSQLAEGYYLDIGEISVFEFPDSPVDYYVTRTLDSNLMFVTYTTGLYRYYTTASIVNDRIIQDERKQFSYEYGRHFDVIKIDQDHVVAGFTRTVSDSATFFLRVGDLSGSSIDFRESISQPNREIDDFAFWKLSNGHFMMIYNDYYSGRIGIDEYAFNGMGIELVDSLMTEKYATTEKSGGLNNLELKKIVEDKFLVAYLEDGNYDKQFAFVLSREGDAYLAGPNLEITSGDFTMGLSMAVLNANEAVITSSRDNSAFTIQRIEINGFGLSLADKIALDSMQYSYCYLNRLDDKTFSVNYTAFELPGVVPVVKVGEIVDNKLVLGERRHISQDFSFHDLDIGGYHVMKDKKILVSYRRSTGGRSICASVASYVQDDNTIDTDQDGVFDLDDAFPDDPALAYINPYPITGFGSVAFEDLYPYMGDYDFNDVVIDFRFEAYTAPDNTISSIVATIVPRASGASFNNGFGFTVPVVSTYDSEVTVQGSHLYTNLIQLNDKGLEVGQSKPVVIAFDRFFEVLPPAGGIGVNTNPDMPFVQPDTIIIQIDFSPSLLPYGLSYYNWNPFIFVDGDRGHEVHLKNGAPTDLYDNSYQNAGDARFGFYTADTYLPWAIETPVSFNYPSEKMDILSCYNWFATWAQNYGRQYPAWYLDFNGYRNDDNIYHAH